MLDIALGAGEKIVDAQHVVAVRKQSIDQVRAEKAGAAGHQECVCGCYKVAPLINLSCISQRWRLRLCDLSPMSSRRQGNAPYCS